MRDQTSIDQTKPQLYEKSQDKPYFFAVDSNPFFHRDISWLQFNERVLGEAHASSNPLLERLKFLAISASNLDEFFMVRIASLTRIIARYRHRGEWEKFDQLSNVRNFILEAIRSMESKQTSVLSALKLQLMDVGISLIDDIHEDPMTYSIAEQVFKEKVLPELALPEAFSPHLLTTLETLQMAVLFDDQNGIFFKIPKKIKPVLLSSSAQGKSYLFFLDQLLLAFLGPAFSLNSPAGIFRITRDGDINVDLAEEDPESIPDIVRTSLGKREKSRAIRIQTLGVLQQRNIDYSLALLKVLPEHLFKSTKTMCMHGLWSALNQLPEQHTGNAKLWYSPLRSLLPRPFRKEEAQKVIFDALKERDFLLQHPYDSFEAYVEWIRAAVDDPDVVMIEQTVYRMDALSPVLELLKRGATKKRVRVVIELRARFDELNNLMLSEELRKAGVEIAFGFGGLKLHAKIALITRMENGLPKLYTHLATGNYNAVTARQYTDLAILTSNADIGKDARRFFDEVMRGKAPQTFKVLVPAPSKLHRRIDQLIEKETIAAQSGKQAKIFAKVNALVDPGVIQSLYKASQAGVQINLMVRGACSLVPGVKGLSENISVISVIDRFLEHSRIYYFSNSKVIYLSSADWMPRNFFSRLELAFPVLDPKIYQYIEQVVIPTYLADKVKGKELTPQGTWRERPIRANEEEIRSQFYFEKLAQHEYLGTPLE